MSPGSPAPRSTWAAWSRRPTRSAATTPRPSTASRPTSTWSTPRSMPLSFQAYFNMVNASKDKGIYGRKLNLTSKRDDQVGMNRQEVQGLISEDNVFAVLPVATLLFTGADLLGQSGIPTFGWNINAEWGSEQAPGPPNMFGEKGSYLCFTCASQTLPWLAQKLHKKKIGVLAYQVAQSADCAKGVQATFDKFPSAKIEFIDTSLAFGVTDLSKIGRASCRERV